MDKITIIKSLESITNQLGSYNFEIISINDGSTDASEDLINNFKKDTDLNIIHSWQEDMGFRASRSRNNAIFKSSGDYIVLIDGDTILHTNFVKDHIENAESGFFVQGFRALLSEKQTKKALAGKKIDFSFFSSELKNRKNL